MNNADAISWRWRFARIQVLLCLTTWLLLHDKMVILHRTEDGGNTNKSLRRRFRIAFICLQFSALGMARLMTTNSRVSAAAVQVLEPVLDPMAG